MIISSNLNSVAIASNSGDIVTIIQRYGPVSTNVNSNSLLTTGPNSCFYNNDSYDVYVRQGESFDRTYQIGDGEDLTDWTCTLQIRDVGQNLFLDRIISTKNIENTQFITQITASETLALDLGIYKLSAQVSNALTGEVYEIVESLYIDSQWVY